MTNESKDEKLKQLDMLVLDKMIELMDSGRTESLGDLTTAVQYLKANQVIQPPKRDEKDPYEMRKAKLKEIKARREKYDL